MKRSQQGQASFLILILVCVLSLTGAVLAKTVLAELFAAKAASRMRQLTVLVQDVLERAQRYEEKEGQIDRTPFTVTLYPDQTTYQVTLEVKRNEAAGLRLLTVAAAAADGQAYALSKLRWTFPQVIRRQAAAHALMVMGSFQGESEEAKGLLYTSEDGAVFPQYAVHNFLNWQAADFLSPADLRTSGLGGRLYYNDSLNSYNIGEGCTVNGDGILVFSGSAVIGSKTSFLGRVVILTDGDLLVGDNVHFQNALIICKGKMSMGNNNILRGAVFVRGDLQVGSNFSLQHEAAAVQPFSTIAYIF